ncbi:MAG: hypothetical protein ACOCXM_02835 [Myxococcota bacterium]
MNRFASIGFGSLVSIVIAIGSIGCDDDDNGDIFDAGRIDAGRVDAAVDDAAVDDAAVDDAAVDDAAVDDAAADDAAADDDDAAVGDGGPGGGDGLSACAQEIIDSQPGTSAACASCTCANCEAASVACGETAGCQGQVACAQQVVSEGTCSADDVTCVLNECSPEGPAVTLLLCIQEDCLDQCTG